MENASLSWACVFKRGKYGNLHSAHYVAPHMHSKIQDHTIIRGFSVDFGFVEFLTI